MRCIVYRGRNGLVLVPDCMRASVEAERDFGPLLRCGEIETDRLAPLLIREIEDALDDSSFARGSAALTLRVAYDPGAVVPLPEGFAWQSTDFWGNGPDATSVVHEPTGLVVGEINADTSEWTWHVITNAHRPWVFRGSYVSRSHGAAMQYLSMWVGTHAQELSRTASSLSVDAPVVAAPR